MIAKITPFLAFLLCCSTLSLQATHNRGGEIEYRQIGPKELEASVITYTKVSSQACRLSNMLQKALYLPRL